MMKRIILFAIVLSLMPIVSGGCSSHKDVFTIGIAYNTIAPQSVLEGFKKGMAELGYIEGKNVKYIYRGSIENNSQAIDAEIKKLLAQDIDLLLTTLNETALRAKKAVEETGVPVLAVACSMPKEIGLIKSMRHPGGNVTGVQAPDTISKGLEWLVRIVPHVKRVYLPYNPYDISSGPYVEELNKTASKLGIELVLHKIHSADEAVTFIETLPGDIDAIYRIPSTTLRMKNSELSEASIKRGLPMGSGMPLVETLMNFGCDYYEMGTQAARLAYQIDHGEKPGDIPFETAEPYLTINLKIAKKVGIHILDDILSQAKVIIR
jgi:putative tryptophan/tyrosine transport system substrate-binding protein